MSEHKSYRDASPQALLPRMVHMTETNHKAYQWGVMAVYEGTAFHRLVWRPDVQIWFNEAVKCGIVFG